MKNYNHKFSPITKKLVSFSKNRGVSLNIFKFKSIDGLSVTSYFCLPKTNFKVPCVVACSAGIHGSFFKKGTKKFDDFHLSWCWHLIKNNIAVLYIDKRGSYGYGKKFQELNEIGGKEVDDIGIGINNLLDYSIIDSKRIYGYGVSRTCLSFILTAIKYKTLRGLFLVSGYYDIKEQMLKTDEKHKKELMGKYSFDNFPLYQRSPLNNIKKISSSLLLLLIHGKNDSTVSFNQSVVFYKKMKEHGHKKIRLIKFSNLPHNKEASNPDNSSGKRILKLIIRFIKK